MIESWTRSHPKTAVILGINGEIGQLLLNVFVSFMPKIVGVDKNFDNIPQSNNIEYIRADFTLQCDQPLISEKIQNADYIALCLPENLCIDALYHFFDYIKNEATIIDTLAIKQNYLKQVDGLLKHSNKKIKILSIHPLFKPILGFKDNNVILISDTLMETTDEDCFIKKIRDLGAIITPSTAVEHDQNMSIVQALTHILILSFGLTLTKTDYHSEKFKNFSTPLQQSLVDLLSRITKGNPHVYWDIQNKNQFNKKMYQQLKQSLDYFIQIISDNNAS